MLAGVHLSRNERLVGRIRYLQRDFHANFTRVREKTSLLVAEFTGGTVRDGSERLEDFFREVYDKLAYLRGYLGKSSEFRLFTGDFE